MMRLVGFGPHHNSSFMVTLLCRWTPAFLPSHFECKQVFANLKNAVSGNVQSSLTPCGLLMTEHKNGALAVPNAVSHSGVEDEAYHTASGCGNVETNCQAGVLVAGLPR